MIKAWISYADGHKTSVNLGTGVKTFGSGIECDVVLPKSESLSGTFTVTCSEGGASVEVGQGVVLAVQNQSGDATILTPAQSYHLNKGDVLRLDGIVIALQGINWPARPVLPSQPSVAKSILRRTLLASSVPVLCAAMYWTVWSGLDGKAVSATSLQSAANVAEQPGKDLQPEITKDDLLAALTERGFKPAALSPEDDGYAATFFVADAARREALLTELNALPVKVVPRIVLDSEISAAVRLSMSLANKEADEVIVRDGVVEISGAPTDETWRKDLTDMLQSDISSLKSVRFSGQSEKWKSEVDDKLMAVWAGRHPYLVLSDGKQVRPGQQVISGVTFIRIKDEKTLLLSVNGNHQEYAMK